MVQSSDTSTSVTLLLRVRQLDDREAWDSFVARYAPQVYAWSRRHNLQESDAADVTQEVLSKLVRAMQTFAYDASRGSFRGWLKTATQNAVRDLVADWRRQGRGAGDTQAVRALAEICDDGASAELEQRVTEQYERELLQEAESRVQSRVQPNTWQAYRLVTAEQNSAQSTAASLQMPVSEVYVAKSRVIKMLREEVARLDDTAESCLKSL
jgi:RNA polymerase sigma-70 factor (ECF subfamily)